MFASKILLYPIPFTQYPAIHMITFIKIAWRNIIRNKARSSITISAIAMGLAALIFLKGFVDGTDNQSIENYTDLLIGHIQIHKSGFQKNMSLDKNISDLRGMTTTLNSISGIKAYSERIKDYTLISSAQNSSGILLLGVEPVNEKNVSKIHERLRSGRFLESSDNDKIIIGKQLAENLGVGLEDKVVIMAQAADGSLAASAYEVIGLIDTGAEEIDKNLALITLKAAQDLLVLNKKVSEVVIKTDSLKQVDSVAETIKRRLNKKEFEVLTWKEISPMTYQWTQFDQVFTNLILLIILIVVASGILNTVLMGVLERTREFGIMLALGTRPQQVTFMVAAESFLLGCIGVVFGGLAGSGAVYYASIKGMDLSVFSHALNSFYIGSVVYPMLDYKSVITYCVIVLLTSIVVSIIPSMKASRLSPIEAIRHNI